MTERWTGAWELFHSFGRGFREWAQGAAFAETPSRYHAQRKAVKQNVQAKSAFGWTVSARPHASG
jgi:hypothetical protein